MKPAALAFITIVFTLIGTRLFADAPATQPSPPQRVTLYAAIVSPGSAWKDAKAAGKPLDLAEHFAYEKTLRDKHQIVMAGPFADGTGGLIVYRADSLDEAKALAANDPATKAKIFDPQMHVWQVNAADVPAR